MLPWKSLRKSFFIFTYGFQIFCEDEEDLFVDSAVYSRFKGRENSQPLSKKPLSSVEVVMVMYSSGKMRPLQNYQFLWFYYI